MNIFLIIFIVLSIGFLFINSKFLQAIKIISNDNPVSADLLKFSIVIAIKNEEKNIPPLIISLRKLFYQKDFFEVIFVDDNSTDNSYQLISESIKEEENIKLFKVNEKKYPGKKGALAFGIEKSFNPYIIITDGDCLPQKNWLISFATKFSQSYDVVFGASPNIKNNSLINKISCFENLRSAILTFSAATFGNAYSAIARSFGFTKNIYEEIGGYEKTTETLSGDDDLFIRQAVKSKAKIGCFIESNSLVFTNSVSNFKEYLKQKARHTSTSAYYLPKHKIFLGFWHLTNLLYLFSPLLMFTDINFGIFFILKIFADLWITNSMQKLLNYNLNFIEIFYLQLIYEILLILNFINSKIFRITWKN
ncbi:MAG: hypothetical protein CO128_09470 [Ignavibacteriales bacterium CG_4_9_14_3_um_filter_30_11]|nr:MAG: hypothetical protein CO128_09470 [Ignavibacteriales bacterium CG_4_9_14_3_um_filter_30_11]